jgi:hypothetical protein
MAGWKGGDPMSGTRDDHHLDSAGCAVKLMDVIDAAADRHAQTPSWRWSSEARGELQMPNVDGGRPTAKDASGEDARGDRHEWLWPPQGHGAGRDGRCVRCHAYRFDEAMRQGTTSPRFGCPGRPPSLSPPDVDGPPQVALFRLRRLEAEAAAAGEHEVAHEFAGMLERETSLLHPWYEPDELAALLPQDLRRDREKERQR